MIQNEAQMFSFSKKLNSIMLISPNGDDVMQENCVEDAKIKLQKQG